MKSKILTSLCTSLALIAQSHIALADAAPNAPSTSQVASEGKMIADGKLIEFSDEGFAIAPPTGWEIDLSHPGLTLVANDTNAYETAINNEKIKFRRYLTVAAIKSPAPIDTERLKGFKEELIKLLGGENAHANLQVTDVKFFNYRGQNDGILAYSTMSLNGVEMMQLHSLVGGAERQFLMTYVDIADSFRKGGSEYQSAWKAMAESTVSGEAPFRYESAVKVASGATLLGLGLMSFFLWRRRSSNSLLDGLELDAAEEGSVGFENQASKKVATSHSSDDDCEVFDLEFDSKITKQNKVTQRQLISSNNLKNDESYDLESDDDDNESGQGWVLPKGYDFAEDEAFVV